MRVAVFFAYVFGLMIGLPALILFLVQREIGPLQWPPPPPAMAHHPDWSLHQGTFDHADRLLGARGRIVDLKPVVPFAAAAAAHVGGDGTLAVALRLFRPQDMARALAALESQYRIMPPIGAGFEEQVATVDGMSGVMVRDATRVILVLGMAKGDAEARLARLPGLATLGTGGDRRPTGFQIAMVAVGVFGWAIAQVFIFGRVASWAGSVPPVRGALPLPVGELQRRLQMLNRHDLPFSVRRGSRPDEVIVDWRYADAKWFDLMRVHGMKRLFRVVLRLDERTRTVRAQDQTADWDWSAGAGGGALRFRASRGINFFLYQREAVLGLQIRGGTLTTDPLYAYRFDLRELRTPVIAAVTEAGWTYRPVITFFRPVGG